MKRLSVPNFDRSQIYSLCVNNVTAPGDRQRYELNVQHLQQAYDAYANESNTQSWSNLPRSRRGHPEQIVAGTLTKGDCTALYEKHMRDSRGAARDVYDQLIVSSKRECPYCAGLGIVETLDHYLPKAYFPLYSVDPHNLVPSCGDCNIGKNAAFPLLVDQQPLHPYFDFEHFFNERWVYGAVLEGQQVMVHFEARPPVTWSEKDRRRATAHFDGAEIAYRYSVKSSVSLSTVVNWRRTFLRRATPEAFSNFLADASNNYELPINGLDRTLYLALSQSHWFCGNVF